MAKILYIGTNGSENPTKSVFPFLGANGAVEAGYEAEISLQGDAVVLLRDAVANSVVPVGWPPLKEVLATNIKNKVPIYV
jgi:predicted peroxiredoxin